MDKSRMIEVGAQLFGQCNGLRAIVGFRAKVVVLFDFKHLAEVFANCGVVVSYQDRLGHQRSVQKAGIFNLAMDATKISRN
jgi:hypothetical protein